MDSETPHKSKEEGLHGSLFAEPLLAGPSILNVLQHIN